MQLSSTLAWLVDAAAETPTSELFLANLGQRLIEDGAPLAGGALMLAAPHPLVTRRTWLWRAGSGEVIEAWGFAAGGFSESGRSAPRRGPALAGGPRSRSGA